MRRRAPAVVDVGYVDAIGRLMKRIESLVKGVDPAKLPLRVYIAGGAAAFFHTGGRTSRDVDATLSLKLHLPTDLEEAYVDRDGNPASVYLDGRYTTLGPLHEDAYKDAEVLEIAAIDTSKVDVRVLAPVDLAISKLGRLSDLDKADIAAMAAAGLIDPHAFERRAVEALDYYVGHPATPRVNLADALKIIRRNISAPKRGMRPSKGRRAK
jgi:hypothetical protein